MAHSKAANEKTFWKSLVNINAINSDLMPQNKQVTYMLLLSKDFHMLTLIVQQTIFYYYRFRVMVVELRKLLPEASGVLTPILAFG